MPCAATNPRSFLVYTIYGFRLVALSVALPLSYRDTNVLLIHSHFICLLQKWNWTDYTNKVNVFSGRVCAIVLFNCVVQTLFYKHCLMSCFVVWYADKLFSKVNCRDCNINMAANFAIRYTFLINQSFNCCRRAISKINKGVKRISYLIFRHC